MATIYTVKVNYKSGLSHTFDVTEFYFKEGRFFWRAVSLENKPIMFGADDVESVWQVGVREE